MQEDGHAGIWAIVAVAIGRSISHPTPPPGHGPGGLGGNAALLAPASIRERGGEKHQKAN